MNRLDSNLLKKIHACSWGENFLKEHPEADGLTFLEIGNKYKLPYEALYFSRKTLRFDEEEEKLYNKLVNIVNSSNVYESHDITSSETVINSEFITNSHIVRSSSIVEDSERIAFSKSIKKSDHIYNSEFINGSYKIVNSKSVFDSYCVVDSTFVNNSNNIYNCTDVLNGCGLRNCTNISNSFISTSCTSANNLLFCYELDNIPSDKYYLFNKEIDKKRFDFVVEQLNSFGIKEFNFTDDWESDLTLSKPISIFNDFRKHYKPLSSLENWIKTLPGYDKDIFNNIITLV